MNGKQGEDERNKEKMTTESIYIIQSENKKNTPDIQNIYLNNDGRYEELKKISITNTNYDDDYDDYNDKFFLNMQNVGELSLLEFINNKFRTNTINDEIFTENTNVILNIKDLLNSLNEINDRFVHNDLHHGNLIIKIRKEGKNTNLDLKLIDFGKTEPIPNIYNSFYNDDNLYGSMMLYNKNKYDDNDKPPPFIPPELGLFGMIYTKIMFDNEITKSNDYNNLKTFIEKIENDIKNHRSGIGIDLLNKIKTIENINSYIGKSDNYINLKDTLNKDIKKYSKLDFILICNIIIIEFMIEYKYYKKLDIYSLGVQLYKLCNNFEIENNAFLMHIIKKMIILDVKERINYNHLIKMIENEIIIIKLKKDSDMKMDGGKKKSKKRERTKKGGAEVSNPQEPQKLQKLQELHPQKQPEPLEYKRIYDIELSENENENVIINEFLEERQQLEEYKKSKEYKMIIKYIKPEKSSLESLSDMFDKDKKILEELGLQRTKKDDEIYRIIQNQISKQNTEQKGGAVFYTSK